MALLNLSLPIIGQSGATEDQKTRDNFNSLQTWANGGIDTTNLAPAAGITEAQHGGGVTGLAKGAFAAYVSANVALSVASPAFASMDAEDFDVSGWYGVDAANGNRYTYKPQAAGYYRLSWQLHVATTVPVNGYWRATLRKNGVTHIVGHLLPGAGNTQGGASGGTGVVQANGSTDFFELIADYSMGGVAPTLAAGRQSYFHGELIGRS